jgi:acetolactate synthase-1/2/3 large subunit
MTEARGTVAGVLASTLASFGVRCVFGIPGGGTSPVLLELERLGITFVLTHGETSAVLMASVDAERTGVPGVVFTSGGPGAASVVDGVAHCKLDRVPLLLITDRLPEAANRGGYHQWLDHRALFAGVVKESMTLGESGTRATLHHASRTAVAGPPGVVHLDLTKAVADGVAVEDAPAHPPSVPQRRPAVPDDVAAVVTSANRPLLLAGLGARSLEPGTLASLAEGIRAPVLTTYKGKGALDETSPWSAGIVTGGAPEQTLFDAADLVVTVGLDDIELFPSMPTLRADRIALDGYLSPPGVLDAPRYSLVGELDHLVRALPTTGGGSRWTSADASAYRKEVEDGLAATTGSGPGIHPWVIARALSDTCSEDAEVTVDAGAHMLPVAQAWRTRRPGSFLTSNGLATMGYGLPASIARSSADPARHVVCCTGDGGLLMVAGELATAARIAHHLTIVVFDDQSLSLIRLKQVGEQVGHGVQFRRPSWVDVARGFGLEATRATDPDGLRSALAAAKERPAVSVVAVETDATPYAAMSGVLRG